MTTGENSDSVIETVESLRLELARCRRQLEDCRQHSVHLADEAVMDMTERKIVEEALRETKAALEFTLRSGKIGDWDLDLVTDTSRRSLRHYQRGAYDARAEDTRSAPGPDRRDRSRAARWRCTSHAEALSRRAEEAGSVGDHPVRLLHQPHQQGAAGRHRLPGSLLGRPPGEHHAGRGACSGP